MTLKIFEVIEQAIAAKGKAAKIKVLQENETWALKDLLRGTYDDIVVWNLPDGDPPFEKPDEHNAPANLHRTHKDFTYFVKGGKGDDMRPHKREIMFIRMLEALPPQESALLLLMKSKTPLGPGLTKKLIKEAYPDLITK